MKKKHRGEKRLDEGSWQYHVVRKWIAAGGVDDSEQVGEIERLEVLPSEVIFEKPGGEIQLRVLAHWTNGDVEDVTDRPAVLHDLALIKVRIRDVTAKSEILRIADGFQARLVDMCPDTAMVEIAGSERRIDTVVEALRGHGILELVRTGRVAMLRGEIESGIDASPPTRSDPAANEGGS